VNAALGKCHTVVFLHDNRLHVDDHDVGAFFHPDVAAIDQIFESLVTVILPLWNEILDSCKRKYDTIRDAILTCAQKLTRVSLIYRTEPTTKKWKTEKRKNGYAQKYR